MENHILNMLKRREETAPLAMHMPSHNGVSILPELSCAYKLDTTETIFTDDLYLAQKEVKMAMEDVMNIFGSEFCFFSSEGSSSLIKAAMLSVLSPGDGVIFSRDCHISVYYGALLSGAEVYTIASAASESEYRDVLSKHKNIKAVVVTSVDYFGNMVLSKELMNLFREYSLTVIADEAHGTHLYFCKNNFPLALRMDCDIVIHSSHKNLGALTGGAIVNCKKKFAEDIVSKIKLISSTSPNYLILSSIEAGAKYLFAHKKENDEMFAMCKNLKKHITENSIFCCNNANNTDPFKVWIETTDCGVCGTDLANILLEQYNILTEMSLYSGVLCYLGFFHNHNDLKKLADSLCLINYPQKKGHSEKLSYPPTKKACTMREAYYKQSEKIDFKNANGRISSDFIVVYPPGRVVVSPGEIINEEVLTFLQKHERLYGVDSKSCVRVMV